MVKDAEFINFLTENEYQESKKVFDFKKHVIIGNGTDLPDKKYEVKKRDEFRFIFVGRYNIFHKGLDILLKSIKLGQSEFREKNIRFIFYGHDSSNGLKYLIEYVKENRLDDLIEINRPVFKEEKEKALLDGDVFIHTSRLEGHPTSVIEAISYGIPVIVTPGTNMVEDVRKNKLGYVCDLNEQSILNILNKAYEDKRNFESISNNEIIYAKNKFDWNIIAKNIIEEYSKILAKEK